MDDKKYLLQTCKHCGNKGLLKIVADYKQHFKEMDGTDVSHNLPKGNKTYVLAENIPEVVGKRYE